MRSSGIYWFLHAGYEEQIKNFSPIINSCGRLRQSSTDRDRAIWLSRFNGDADNFLTSRLLWSTSPTGKTILGLAEKDKIAALGELAFMHNVRFFVQAQPINEGLDFSKIAEISFFHHARSVGWKGNVDAERAALESLRNEWDERFDLYAGQHEWAVQAVSEARSHIEAESERQKKEYEDILNQARQRIAELESTFLEKLRLEAPAKYWRDKAEQHNRASWVAFVALVACGAGTLATVVYWARDILEVLRSRDGQISLGAVALAGPVAFLVLYFFRLLIRIFTQNQMGAADARQRRALIYTYLSLINKKNGAVTEQERLLILQALFRSTQAAAEEDVPPANLIDLMMKAADAAKKPGHT